MSDNRVCVQEPAVEHQQLFVGAGHEDRVAVDGGLVAARAAHPAAAQQAVQDPHSQLQSLTLRQVGIQFQN